MVEKKMKIGLVLGGGGAKGAYHAGCLKALNERGISKFEYIGGTSIGALTAAAVSNGNLEKLIELWTSMKLSKILSISKSGILLLPFLLYGQFLGFLSKPKNLLWAITSLVFYYQLPILLLIIGILFTNHAWVVLFKCLSFCSFLFLSIGHFNGYKGQVLLSWGRIISSLFVMKTSLGKKAKYEAMITELLTIDRPFTSFRPPTFVTIAKKEFWFDPDYPSFCRGKQFYYHDILSPYARPGYLPKYVDISKENPSEAKKLILASGSLPFLFPLSKLEDGYYMDGGVVDNLPVYNALSKGCDILIVINLSNDETISSIKSRMLRLDRAFRINALTLKNQHKLYLSWLEKYSKIEKIDYTNRFVYQSNLIYTNRNEIIKEVDNFKWPKIILVDPSQNLGGWIQGTLNFRNSKCRRLFDLGYNDTLLKLKEFNL